MSQILEDAAEEQAINFMQEFESHDEETNKFMKQREVDPKADEKESKKLADQINRALGLA